MNSSSSTSASLYNLDKSFYPPEWDDDARMEVLFIPFRVRTLNPINYDSKLKFWKEMVVRYGNQKGCAEITTNELKDVFRRKGKRPNCMQTVIDEMWGAGEIRLKEDFMEMPQHTWGGWAVNSILKRPMKWGINKVRDTLTTTKDDTTEYIVMETVQSQSRDVRKLMEHHAEKVVTLADALEKCVESGLSLDGAHYAIHQLDHEQKVFIDRTGAKNDPNKIIIKFAAINQKVTPITDLERSIHSLETTEKSLLKVIDKCEEEIKRHVDAARQYVKDGRRSMAKNSLRKKKMIDKNLEKRLNTLENIQVLLSRIHESTDDSHVIDAYKMGSTTIKKILADSGITLDSVDDAISEVRETMELHDDIQSALGQTQVEEIDETGLEEELENLLKGDNNVGGGTSETSFKEDEQNDEMKRLAEVDDSIERRLAQLRMDSDGDISSVATSISPPRFKSAGVDLTL